MNITFQKKDGNPTLGIQFFWKLEIKTKSPVEIRDYLIPELFFDFFYVQAGHVVGISKEERPLTRQFLKTIFTGPLQFVYSAPLVVFGARLSLNFAELFWGDAITPNSLLPADWLTGKFKDLESFATKFEKYLAGHQVRRLPVSMFNSALSESDWLAHYSARHKRRLYQNLFGVSRKELQNIGNLQMFLAQTCDFGSQNPRIIRHVNPDVYYDQPHLNRSFKKLTGVSPVEYFEANSILQDNLMSASYNAD